MCDVTSEVYLFESCANLFFEIVNVHGSLWIHIILYKIPKKKVGWGEVWRIWRPHNWSTLTALVAVKCIIQVITNDCGPMRRCTVLLKHNIHAVVLLQLGYEKVLQHVQVRSWSNCFLPKYDYIVGVHSPTKMEGSLVRKYPSIQEVVIFLHMIAHGGCKVFTATHGHWRSQRKDLHSLSKSYT